MSPPIWRAAWAIRDLCHLGGFPGPLRKVLGIWAEETDTLYPEDRNHLVSRDFLSGGEYEIRELCDLIHCETAESLGEYRDDFYAGRPALTVNSYGKGKAYYIAGPARGGISWTLSMERYPPVFR